MIGIGTILIFVLQALVAVIVPTAIAVVWCKKKGQPFGTFLIGGAVFFVFVYVVEAFINSKWLFSPNTAVGKTVLSTPALYVIVGALMAGVFEETGRLIAFKFFLKNKTEKETAITYGLGHGGFEVILLVGVSGISNIATALLINSPAWETTLQETAKVAPDQLATLEALPAALASVTFGALLLSFVERIGAVLLHTGCSIVVFKAVNGHRKMWLYPVAILIHALVDVMAALYQVGVITNMYLIEGTILVLGGAVFAGAYLLLYKREPQLEEI